MKILLPVDGSDCALRAVDHLLAHGDWYRDVPEVHLLHVHAPIPIGRVQAHVGKETLHAYYLEEGQVQLLAAQKKFDAAGCSPASHIHVGQPPEVIARMVAELGCDLVIMGTHGRSTLAGLVMGSVANKVLHLVACPVLLIK